MTPPTPSPSRPINLLKALALFGVILIHAVLPFTSNNPFWKNYVSPGSQLAEIISFWGNLLIIPAFTLASGYLAFLSQQRRNLGVGNRVRERAKRLLLPWFLVLFLWVVPLYWLLDYPAFNRPAGLSLGETYLAALKGLFNEHLWFLLALFWVSLFWALIQPLTKRLGVFFGAFLSLILATIVQLWGQNLTWFCFKQISAPLIHFSLGQILACYRFSLENTPRGQPLWTGLTLIGFLSMTNLLAITPGGFPFYWLATSAGAFSFFLGALWLAPCASVLRRFRPYAFYEERYFRFYLFHMPGQLVLLYFLHQQVLTNPVAIMGLNIALTFLLTGIIVALWELVEKKITSQ
jgi:hypothetical protein